MSSMIPNMGRIRSNPYTSNGDMVIISGSFLADGGTSAGAAPHVSLTTNAGKGFWPFLMKGEPVSVAKFAIYFDSTYAKLYSFSASAHPVSGSSYICLGGIMDGVNSDPTAGVPGTSFTTFTLLSVPEAGGAPANVVVPIGTLISFHATMSTSRLLG